MSFNQVQNAFDILGQGLPPAPRLHLPGHLEPRLEVAWGEFRQSAGSSIRALFSRSAASRDFIRKSFFKDAWIESPIPVRALLAAALWHIVFLVMPSPRLAAPQRNPAFENVELTWSGPINDLPLLEIPQPKAAVTPRAEVVPVEAEKTLAPLGADAFHPRQRIFTDAIHPTHPTQTLINPVAPPEAPKILTALPNIVLFKSAAPPRPRLQISEDTLKKLRPVERRAATTQSAALPDLPNTEERVADINLSAATNAPARPALNLNASAAPRVAQKTQTGNNEPAPQIATGEMAPANGSNTSLVALSSAPAPPAPAMQAPQGNLSARVAISPEGKTRGVPGGVPNAPPSSAVGSAAPNGGAGKNSVGVSISGGNPSAKSAASGLGGADSKISAPPPRALLTRPEPREAREDTPQRTGPPDFSTLPPGAKPEVVFAARRVYTMNVNMPNLNSSTGSWILNFSEFQENTDTHHAASPDLSSPVPLRKVDPKYPPLLVADRVEGEVILYAVIREDGAVSDIKLIRGIDDQLDANAMSALAQWKFRPAMKENSPVEVEVIAHIPFRLPNTR